MVLTSAASVGAELVSAEGLGEMLASMDGLGEVTVSLSSAAVLADGLGEVAVSLSSAALADGLGEVTISPSTGKPVPVSVSSARAAAGDMASRQTTSARLIHRLMFCMFLFLQPVIILVFLPGAPGRNCRYLFNYYKLFCVKN